jgi:signal transduction histidine kinase/CheY-like chemotaxis protein
MLKIRAHGARTSAWILLLALWLCLPMLATSSERGRVPVSVITMQDLAAPANTNSVTALADGRMLVSNVGALMSYDGVTWRKFRHPQGLGYLSALAFSSPNTLYAGWQSELGWFEVNGLDDFVWHSLLDKVALADRAMGDVTTVLMDAARGGVWYISNRRVFFWSSAAKTLTKVVESAAITASLVDGELWLSTPQTLLRLTSAYPTDLGALKPVPGSQVFAGRTVRKVLNKHSGALVVQADALYWRATHSGEFLPFASALSTRFMSERIADVISLQAGGWAVLLQTSQLLVLSPDGALRAEFGADDGIPANPGKSLFEDRFGSLWIAQERTLTTVHLGRGLTRFDATSGLPGADSLERWNGTLFVGQTKALYRMLPGLNMAPARFERVLPTLVSAICMASTFAGKRMFVAGYGLHEVFSANPNDASSALRSEQLIDLRVCNRMEASRFVAGRIWVAHTNGLLRVDMTPSGVPVLTPMSQVTTPVDAVAEIDANQLLLFTHGGGTTRVSAQAGVQLPAISANLPVGPVKLFPGKARPWVLTQKGLWQFNTLTAQFEQPSGLPSELRANKAFSILEDRTGILWVRGTDLQSAYLRNDATPPSYTHLDTLDGFDKSRTVYRFLREGDIVWMSRSDDLLRLDLSAQKSFPPAVRPRLAGVQDLKLHSPIPLSAMATLPDTARNFRFSFALPSTLDASKNAYRSKLSSIDTDWSPWSERTDREFSALPDGWQTFEVQARDSLGRISSMPPLALRITPPWFRTLFAYVSFASAALFALWLAAKVGGRRRQRLLLIRQDELEATVASRTIELIDKNAQLAEQANRLQEVDRLKTRFFINVGHEFRTPLTLVLGPVDDLLRDMKERFSSKAREQLELVQRNAKRVLDLIVELLDVNRFEHGQLSLQLEPIELNQWLSQITEEAHPLLARYGHTIAFVQPEGLTPVWARVDVLHLERAIANLLSNAAKYMRRGGVVSLAISVQAETLEIRISDQGRGIAAQALPHVFDRFYQAEGGDQASGYGIGLALVREIVEAHGGSIRVESQEGEGSTFVISLSVLDPTELPFPAAAMPLGASLPIGASIASMGDSAMTASGNRVRVLVVDDHADLRARLKLLLATKYDVFEAADGPSALLAIQQHLPDVVVCDVMMPGFDGVELCRRVRADPDIAAIGLLLLTAKVGSEHAVAGLTAGANDYLAKPFDASELLARVGALLAHAMRLRIAASKHVPALTSAEPELEAALINASDAKWRQRLDATIVQHLSEPSFDIEALASAMHCDRSTLFRRCKSLFEQAPGEYLREARLQQAHRLLMQAVASVSEVGFVVGFENLSSFTRAFKAHYGYAPSQTRSQPALSEQKVS